MASIVSMASIVFSSCEDMFTPENNLVSTELAPQDTLYQMMGIVKKVQALAERMVVLGEARADLVTVNPTASTDLQNAANSDWSSDNVYNNPSDYYAVINSCNIYLAKVDSMRQGTHGAGDYVDYYYEKEILAAKVFRAWTYLELAKVYGSVPFITEPVLTAAEAELGTQAAKKDMEGICTWCIDDLLSFCNDHNMLSEDNLSMRPSYGGKYSGVSFANFFIPVRVMLGELYLYRGSFRGQGAGDDDFLQAARMYHDFLTFEGETHPVSAETAWSNHQWRSETSTYSPMFKFGGTETTQCDNVAIIPLDTIEINGTVCDLRALFCSTYKNNFYAPMSPSASYRELSQAQDYCYYNYRTATSVDTLYAPKNMTDEGWEDNSKAGDLRYSAIYNNISYNVKDRSDYNDERQMIAKYSGGASAINNDIRTEYVPYYRYTIIYLHLAEALNHAGFPETAFAVLKYGLSEDLFLGRTMFKNPNTGMNPVSAQEYARLNAVKSTYLFGNDSTLAVWENTYFKPRTFSDPSTSSARYSGTHHGIHSIGSGDSEFNAKYELPYNEEFWTEGKQAVADSLEAVASMAELEANYPWSDPRTEEDTIYYAIAMAAIQSEITTQHELAETKLAEAYEKQYATYHDFVAEKILDEEALEGAYEGYRLYDLMRYAKYYGKPLGQKMSDTDNKSTLNEKLKAGNWYLPLK